MLTMLIERYRSQLFMLMCLGLLTTTVAEAQFIRFTINLPPSFELKDRPNPPQILEPVETSGKISKDKSGVRWMEIRASENVPMLIEFRMDRSRGGLALPKMYFLNDGTTNFSNAESISPGYTEVVIRSGNKLITELADKPKYLSAWLGLPAFQGGVLTVTYP